MHIAVCDDNVADRKQLERLLGRESDKRMKLTGNLYVDSFGSVTALLHAPMMYDLFLVDYHSDNLNGMDVAHKLREAGVTAPIVLMSGLTNYTNYSTAPSNIHHLNKPILQAELSDMISRSLDYNAALKPPVAIQGEGTTLYIPEEQLVIIFETNHTIYLHLSDGTVKSVLGLLTDIEHTLENNPFFIMVGKTIVNLMHVSQVSIGKLHMSTGEVIKFSAPKTHYYKKMLEEVLLNAKSQDN
ncbi:MAG: hypothetical protein KBS85_05415 [Lachnospiraceae bacterium]|nr:hypothetical protein [Candidatus Merdinaster equi]